MSPRLLRRYYWYQTVSAATLFQAVFFVYYGERAGLSLAAILALQSFNTGLRAVLDLPLGAFADRVSRRLCLVASSAGIFLGAAVLLVWPSLPGALVAEAFFALAAALRSGADSALLYDALHADGRLDLYPHAESRGQAMASLGSGSAAVLGGLLAAVDLSLPYLATLLSAGAGAVLASTLEERRHVVGAHRGRIAAAARLAASSAAVRWTVAVAMLSVTSSHVYYYLQQPYLRAIGVPLALFGVVFATTKLVTALVAASAHRIDAVLGQRASVGLMAVVPASGLGSMALVGSPAGALLILTRGVLDGLWMPLVNVYLNRLVGSELRATMLSLQSVLARLALSATLAVLGAMTAEIGLWTVLGAVAAVVAILGAALVLAAPEAARRAGVPRAAHSERPRS